MLDSVYWTVILEFWVVESERRRVRLVSNERAGRPKTTVAVINNLGKKTY